jgi:hypothetical protein
MRTHTYVQSIDETSKGRYLVTTKGSQHIWDLDAMTYQRLPGTGNAVLISSRAVFAHDGDVLQITAVERWPEVGHTSLVWFDDPAHPQLLEHWRQSSTIVSIELLGVDDAQK